MDVQQFVWVPYVAVGASLLAKVVNDDAGRLVPRVALRFFASELLQGRGISFFRYPHAGFP
ncbi:hypothetical protein C1X27_14125 [Pseudomonas sp. MPR-AND1B]|nr:hypothetical protein C1X26_19435 [Pseudomonas sp. MPR-R3A]PMY99214.1 hypothetical protein C1X24_06735 [Pseudomonas sp. FW305-124]PMZ68420.1 hypothetical protein C1X25_23225 [Pseudomonas sp. GW247-3R2A]PNA95249.1 hypothetical protein C1X23_06120 [Pseudomonas sp. FW300-E2]PNB02447.1 hypothetical protein C1X27_14125 [Pseudomonas sp. MPR-AND1B]POH39453.1 hypothetical protein C2U56_21045 [Pseudomonas fluorescens]RZI23851.1 hypothetical protein EUX58_15380 [Pseudomonas sp. 770NI]